MFTFFREVNISEAEMNSLSFLNEDFGRRTGCDATLAPLSFDLPLPLKGQNPPLRVSVLGVPSSRNLIMVPEGVKS
jgi:hypothetical protein